MRLLIHHPNFVNAIVVVAFIVMTVLNAVPAEAKDVQGWNLLYDTSFSGQVRSKIDIEFNQVYLKGKMGDALFRPPNYALGTYLNGENKTYITIEKAAFVQGGNYNIDKCIFEKVGPEKVCDIPCTRYKLFQKLRTGKKSHVGDMWTTDYFMKNKQLVEAMCNACAAPIGYGVPVKIILKAHYAVGDEGELYGSRGPFLILVKKEKTTFKPETFEIPPSYHRAKSADEFLFSMDGNLKQSDLDDLFRKKMK